MSDFHIRVYMKPVGKGRPRLGRGGGVFTPSKTRRAEKEFARYVRLKMGVTNQWRPLSGPLMVTLEFGLLRPKSSKREYPTVSPDLDNMIKLVLDSCNGLLFEDDKQVIRVTASKLYTDSEYINLVVESI